jgi:hypothetical protein
VLEIKNQTFSILKLVIKVILYLFVVDTIHVKVFSWYSIIFEAVTKMRGAFFPSLLRKSL